MTVGIIGMGLEVKTVSGDLSLVCDKPYYCGI